MPVKKGSLIKNFQNFIRNDNEKAELFQIFVENVANINHTASKVLWATLEKVVSI